MVTVIQSQCYNTAYGCDSRCNCCNDLTDLSNLNCQTCNTSFPAYMWLVASPQTGAATSRCDTYCPPGQYINTTVGSCAYCHPYCETCTAYGYTFCSTCATTAFLYNSTTCYNLPDHTWGTLTYYNPCVDGTYAWPLTMRCIKCPTGTLTCSIGLDYMMPSSYQNTRTMTAGCTNDSSCLWAIKSYTCSAVLSYIWVQFFCQPINQCREYAYYASTSTTFDPSACTCIPNYYQSGFMACSRCHISCLQCSYNTDTTCTGCPDGFTLATGSCSTNGTSVEINNWETNYATTSNELDNTGVTNSLGSYTASPNLFTTDCGNTTLRYLWGCTGATCYKGSLTYSIGSGLGTSHYGVRVRFVAVFVDGWPSSGALYISSGGQNVFSYNYNSYGVVGEFLCLRNVLDVVQVVDGWWNHTTDSLSFTLQDNGASVGSSTIGTYYVGIREMIVYKLICDSSCATCSSYTSSDCTSCPNVGQIVFNWVCDPTVGDCTNLATPPGQCVCDTGRGYFYDTTAGACVLSCTNNATVFKDKASRQCVSTCPQPLAFGDTSNVHRYCMIKCPTDYYKDTRTANKTCLSSCFVAGVAYNLNYYKFNGTDPACFNPCPSGLVADQYTGACLQSCSAGYYNSSGYCLPTCPAGTYAYNVSNICVSTCPDGYFRNNKTGTGDGICEYPCTSWNGVKLYGDNSTGNCVNTCPTGTYSDLNTHMCVTFCNKSAAAYKYGQIVNLVGTCVTMCTSNFDGSDISYGNPITGFCVNASDCPTNYFGDKSAGATQNMCVQVCSNASEYGVNYSKKCEASCGTNGGISVVAGGYKYNTTKVCVSICPTSPSLFGVEGGYCESACTGAYFADAQWNRTCRLNCSATPAPSFGQNFVCVSICANVSGNPTWGDPYSSTRACTTNCTHVAPNTSYGYTPLNLCVLKCPDTWFGYVQSTGVPICTQTCPQAGYDLFGDNLTNLCTTNCPATYYGDPTGNRLCVMNCPDTYFAYDDGLGLRTCGQTCPTGYADNLTRVCVSTYTGCGNGTYGDDSDNKCELPGANCPTFADPITQSCVSACPNTSTYRYFGDSSTSMCVLICPNLTASSTEGTFGDNHTKQCETSCSDPTEVRDYQNNRRCVADNNCSRLPVALFADTTSKICVTAANCPASTFADNFTFKCESTCQGTVLLYADPVSRFCVATCPNGYYAANVTGLGGICSLNCTVPLWADNATITCTSVCTTGTYGVNDTGTGFGKCEKQCPSGQFARDTVNQCVSDCGPGRWGNTLNRVCETSPFSCPDGYYANNVSNLCVVPKSCQLVGATQYVADNSTKECKPGCPLTTPRNYADMSEFLCVALCPIGYYGENNTLKCLTECKNPTTLAYYGSFADWQNRICVAICSASNTPTFGETTTYTCVEALSCPAGTWAEDAVYSRRCVPVCPPPNTLGAGNLRKYADNTTKECVVTCPSNYFGSTQSGVGMCVSLCEVNTLFADNQTTTCVPLCPSTPAPGTFGDQNLRTCVDVCPINFYADTSTRYCVPVCPANSWGQPISRVCLTDNTACPIVNKYKQYADNYSHMCVSTCPLSQNTWGENSTWFCVSTCVTGFKYLPTRVCIDLCPLYLNGTGLFSDQGMCYSSCITANYYRDPQASRSCVSVCSSTPNNSYADDTTMNCVQTCPVYPVMYYAYDGDWTCKTSCIGGTYMDPTTQKCVNGCPSETLLDANTNTCVQVCPYDLTTIYYADLTQTQPVCVLASACPSTYYGDFNTRKCTQACSNNQLKNNNSKTCVTFCPDGLYASSTGYCVTPSNCPAGQYANNMTKTCVSICNGSFADTANKVCVFVCPAGLYADTYTRICQSNCTNNATVQLYISTTNQTCVSACSPPLYLNVLTNTCESGCPSGYYADPSTSTCVTSCPISPQLYALDNGRVCVEFCPTGTPQYYTNNQTRKCVTACDTGYYRDNLLMSCVSSCSDPYFIEDTLGYCVLNCSTKFALDVNNTCLVSCPSPYFADSTTYKCVLNCPVAPTYYKLIVGSSRTCSLTCPSGQWADQSSRSCVTACPSSPPKYADNSTWSCVSVCPYQNGGVPFSLYALNSTRSCVSSCPAGMFAENTTRTCVYQCPNGTDTYADNTLSVPSCVPLCSSGLYADLVTLTCTAICPASPRTYAFSNSTTRLCVASCPYPLVSDDSTYTCVSSCPSTIYPYLDKSTKSCVTKCPASINLFGYLATGATVGGNCVNPCPTGWFSDNTTRTCLRTCPAGTFAETQNNTCSLSCSEINNHFADSVNHVCVPTCPYNSSYDSYGDKYTRACVTSCNTSDFTFADPNTRLCEKSCSTSPSVLYKDPTTMKCVIACPSSPTKYFADNVTMTCVLQCSRQSKRYGYIPDGICYLTCPGGLFANDATRLCVVATGCQAGYFADPSTWTCVAICPTSQSTFGDPTTQTCLANCPTGYFRDSSTRLCVSTCPQIPNLFADNGTKNCVTVCPGGSFADNNTRVCVANCPSSPTQTFADDSTHLCVTVCPTQPDYFSENITWTCTAICPIPNDMYADYASRKCVYNCPNDSNNTFADSQTRLCVAKCPDSPIMTFNDNSTQRCKTSCTTGFADRLSKFCVAVCPNYYYGETYTNTCVATCPIKTPKLFAEDPSRMCVTSCNASLGLFADSYTSRCVEVCPIDNATFADSVSQTCVSQCPSNPLSYADASTRTCVSICPSVPSLFAINSTRVCVANCPSGSFADNSTRLCVAYCNTTSPMTYGDNSTWSCVATCPTEPWYFADSSTHLCVSVCPGDTYADNTTRTCVYPCADSTTYADPTTHKCVTVCPDGYFGDNTTMRCVTDCPTGSFADVLLNLCVAKCSVDPIYYGNPLTKKCVTQCPISSLSFGNPLSQECVSFNASGYSGCPLDHFSDNSTRLCVPVCPMLQDTYSDNFTRMCVAICPNSTKDTYADNSTMRCVDLCPSMPDYYAEETSRRCVKLCLAATPTFAGTFANNVSRRCVSVCPSTPDYYSDNSTRRCVYNCPVDPLTFADNSTRRCVTTCPDTPQDLYGDLSSGRCVLLCPEAQLTYADNTTRRCERVCNASALLFGENVTNRCVKNCPSGSYADNSSRLCVAVCPDYQDTYGDPTTNTCVSQCPIGWFADPFSQICVSQCPFLTTPIIVKTYGQQYTRRCVTQCPFDRFMYADDLTHLCTDPCPISQGTYGDDTTKRCVNQCPDVPFLYAQNITRRCNSICPNVTNGGFAENLTRMCVVKCPDGTYGDPISLYCKFYCESTYYADDTTNTCVQMCPPNLFADNTTRHCVAVCPVSHLLFGVLLTRTCDISCPAGTYADSFTQRCQTQCPGSQDTYAYDGNNTCVNECPYPLYAYNVTYVCLATCPDPYFPNVQDHRCYRCPMECAVCQYAAYCTLCISGYYLYAGTCVASCPITPVVTYANVNGTCGTSLQCSAGYFALNSTKSCVTVCPSGYYKNTMTQTCEYCMKGCSSCNNYSICLACNSLTALWDNYTCYPFCSRLQRYYYGSGCTSSCPAGTYLNLTFCDACDPLCNTCELQPANCLTCADGLYLQNHLCVQSCPNNSRPMMSGGSLVCQACGTGGLNCTTTGNDTAALPLTFTVNQTVENYKFKLYLSFNQKVNVTGNLKSIFQIVQVGARRLLAAASTVNYTIIDYGNGVYGFLIDGFDASISSGLKFELQILNPMAITTASGSIPQQTRMQITLPTSQYYDMANYNDSFRGYAAFVSWVSLLMMVGLVWTKAEVWMPMLDVLQVLFVLYFINVVMPPNLAFMLAAFRVSFLSFLPNMFAAVLPKPVMTARSTGPVYSLIGDFLFLRNEGYLLTVTLVLVLAIAIVLLLIRNKKIIKDNNRRLLLKKVWKEVVLGRCLHGLAYLLFLPTIFFAMLQMRDYTLTYPVVGFSIFISLVYMLLMLAVLAWLLYKVISFVKKYPVTMEALARAYNLIKASPPELMEIEQNRFWIDDNDIDLRNLSEPRINNKLILPFQIETHLERGALAAPFVGYFSKLLIAVFVVACFNKALAQLLLVLAVEVVRFGYIIFTRAYIYKKGKFMLRNWLAIANIVIISFIVVALIIFDVKYMQLAEATRVILGDVACYLIAVLITYNLVFLCYRFYEEWHYRVWRPFVYSECFKNNFPIQHFAFIEEYEKEKKETLKHLRKKKKQLAADMGNIQKQVQHKAQLDVKHLEENKPPLGEKRQTEVLELRPTQKQIIKKDLETFVNDVYERQKSHSHKSSGSLSRKDRKKMVQQIFAERTLEKHNRDDQFVKIEVKPQSEPHRNELPLRVDNEDSGDEYDYEYYEEEYPEDADMREVLGAGYKGDFVLH